MATDNLMPQSSTSIIKHFMLRDSTTGQGLTGKVHSDFSGKYNIAGGVEVTLAFSSGTAGDAYSSGKICPLGLGKYAWHVPNAVFASLGNVSAVLSVTGGIDVHCEWLVVADSRDLPTKPVNLTQIGGVAQSATDLKDFADTGYDPSTHKVQGVVLVDTTTTNTDMRGTDSAMLAASYSAPPSAATISSQVASDLAAAHGAGSWATATGFSTHSAADVLAALGTGSWATSLAQSSVWTPTVAGRIDVATSTRLAPTVSGRTLNVNTDGEGDAELDTAVRTAIAAAVDVKLTAEHGAGSWAGGGSGGGDNTEVLEAIDSMKSIISEWIALNIPTDVRGFPATIIGGTDIEVPIEIVDSNDDPITEIFGESVESVQWLFGMGTSARRARILGSVEWTSDDLLLISMAKADTLSEDDGPRTWMIGCKLTSGEVKWVKTGVTRLIGRQFAEPTTTTTGA